ncbi:MAG: CoA transferase [SAR202 cluster bacterium]|jgi:crotonobetainyl-CoA:carnitine CoA-transferase CaiB-like acyl-CoA transferase|nr:CoA transferase [SAR202 cluster bacterium]MDP6514922.1 CoA transferase [SAR202 cluster bacterium]MDP6714568.1 CoA transferase [SAR202 cluster bacterium]
MPSEQHNASEQPTALGHLRVLDLTFAQTGYFGKIFADLGADVIKIEPPQGDPARRMAPFAGDFNDPEHSLYFLNFNANKRGVTLDLETDAGRASLSELASGADVLVESYTPGYMDGLGVGYDALRQKNPGLVFASITPFGQTGPYAEFQGSELVTQAMGGVMYIQGDDLKPPCYAPCDQASQLASLHAAYGTLTALQVRNQTGRGQHVDVSMQDIVGHLLFNVAQYGFTREIIRRTGATPTIAPNGYYACRDGYVSLAIFFPHHWATMLDWMDIEALQDPIWRDLDFRRSNPDIVNQFVSEFISDFTVDDFVREGQARHLTVSAMSTMERFANDEHIEAREFFRDASHPDIGDYSTTGAPYRFGAAPWASLRPAPRLGQHTQEVLSEAQRQGKTNGATAAPANNGRPLSGLRIVDFARVWAGPYATRYLGDLGAEVIKIENENFLDGGRISPDGSPMFSEINRSKLGVTVNFREADGADLIRELVSVSDVVLDNFAAGVLDRRGLGYEDLRKIRPDIIMISMPGYGNEGPYSDYVAYGQSLMAYAGLAMLWGFPDSPVDTRPNVHYSDFVSAAHGSFALMSALEHRAQTGQGQYIEIPQAETLAATMGVALLDHSVNGRPWQPIGNRHPSFAPHGCYPCQGEDQWCAISCLTDEHWQSLCEAINAPELVSDSRFDSLNARLQNQDALDEIIGEWTKQFTPYQVMWLLQDIGVPAGVAQSGEQLYHDMNLRSRNFIERIQHHNWRTLDHSGITVKLSETPGAITRGLPGFGQHNSLIFGDLLGFDASEIERMVSEGAIA